MISWKHATENIMCDRGIEEDGWKIEINCSEM